MKKLLVIITLMMSFSINAHSNDDMTLMLYNGFYVKADEKGELIESTKKNLGVPLVGFHFANDEIWVKINTPPTTTIQEYLIKPHIATYLETDNGFEILFAVFDDSGYYRLVCEIDGDMEMLGISRLCLESSKVESMILMYNNRDDILRLLDADVSCIYSSLLKFKRILKKYKWNGQ